MSRDNKGRFKKGSSGNPKGRSRRADDIRQLLEGGADEVAHTIIEAAKGGDMTAARILMDRCSPVPKATLPLMPFEISTESPSETARSIYKAIGSGAIPPDIGKALIDSCAALAKVEEIDDLTKRIEALEQAQEASS